MKKIHGLFPNNENKQKGSLKQNYKKFADFQCQLMPEINRFLFPQAHRHVQLYQSVHDVNTSDFLPALIGIENL